MLHGLLTIEKSMMSILESNCILIRRCIELELGVILLVSSAPARNVMLRLKIYSHAKGLIFRYSVVTWFGVGEAGP